jgi:two-component system, NarL family, sensor histidine kinase LiaS
MAALLAWVFKSVLFKSVYTLSLGLLQIKSAFASSSSAPPSDFLRASLRLCGEFFSFKVCRVSGYDFPAAHDDLAKGSPILEPVFKTPGLYRQLSLSHLLVTSLTALSLALCILLGYWLYASSGRVARWVAFDALTDANYIVEDYVYEELPARSPLDPELVAYYLTNIYHPYLEPDRRELSTDEEDVPEFYTEQLVIVLSPEGETIASNLERHYPPGERISDVAPTGFKTAWLETSREVHQENPYPLLRSAVDKNFHVGFAPIISEDVLLGWVYLRYESETRSQFLRNISRTLALGSLGAALIAVVISALVGNRLARALSGRLSHLSQLSRAYALGDLSQRYETKHQDEIAQLGQQLNTMAVQIEEQMLELRDLADKNARLLEESKALAVLEERNRLARDLHDAVKQQLFGLNLTLGAVKQLLKTQPETASLQLENASQLASQTLNEMDTIIKQLRPVSLERKDLSAALQDLLEQWAMQAGIKTHFDVSDADVNSRLPLAHEQCLYRVAQEALQNVAKHAGAKNVRLELSYLPNNVTLSIRDDGKGFDTSRQRSHTLGLRSMKERAEALGGRLELYSDKNGTQLSVTLPLEALSLSERLSHG